MKAGFENRSRVAIMTVLLVIAVYAVSRSFVSTPPTTAAAPATAAQGAARSAASQTQRARCQQWWDCALQQTSLNPTLKSELLKSSEGKQYTGGRRNPFDMESEPPPAPPPVVDNTPKCPGPDPRCGPPPPVCPGPDPRCPPPAINLKFYGFASKPGEPRRIFLAAGEDVFIAAEGEVVQRRYRIVRITPNSVEVEDVLNNNRQTLPLTAQ